MAHPVDGAKWHNSYWAIKVIILNTRIERQTNRQRRVNENSVFSDIY